MSISYEKITGVKELSIESKEIKLNPSEAIYIGNRGENDYSYLNICSNSAVFCSSCHIFIGASNPDRANQYAEMQFYAECAEAHITAVSEFDVRSNKMVFRGGSTSEAEISFHGLPYYSGSSKEGCSYNNYNYFATQSYVESALEDSLENYQPVSLSIGNGACVVDITTGNGYIAFDDTKIPTTGIDFDKPTPYTCVYWLCECTPVDGIVAWDIRLKCGESDIQSVIPPHVSILRQDSSTGFGGVYVNADVSSVIEEDVGVPINTTVHIEMASTETIPANTFKAVVSNIYSMCLE